MPISLQVQMMRHAISPRLAIRIFLNLRGLKAIRKLRHKKAQKAQKITSCFLRLYGLTLNSEEWLTVFNRLAILNVNFDYFSTRLSLNLIHELHGFDNANNCVGFDVAADLHKRLRGRRRRTVERSDNG